jgi:hypothetical protein
MYHAERNRKIYVFRQAVNEFLRHGAIVIVLYSAFVDGIQYSFVDVLDFHVHLSVITNTSEPATWAAGHANLAWLALPPVAAILHGVVSTPRAVADTFVSPVTAKVLALTTSCLHFCNALRAAILCISSTPFGVHRLLTDRDRRETQGHDTSKNQPDHEILREKRKLPNYFLFGHCCELFL